MNAKTKLAVAMAVAITGALGAQAQSALSLYNVIVKGNLDTTSDIEGKIVAQNYVNQNSATLAKNVSAPGSTDTVLIAGNVAGSGSNLTIQNGSLALGPSANLNGRSVVFNGGGTTHANSSFDFNAVFNGITAESTSYANPANYAGSVSATPTANGNDLNFSIPSASNGKVLFFSVAAGSLGVQNQNIRLVNENGATPTAIIINVTGATSYAEQGGVNFGGLFGTANNDPWTTKTLWNFNGYSSLSLNGWRGSILAASASVNNSGSILYGSVAANNLTTTSEVHLPNWSGVTLAPVPEASTYAAVGAVGGMIGLGWYRRNRKA